MSDPDIDVIEIVIQGPPGPVSPGVAGGGLTFRLRPDLSGTSEVTLGNGQVRGNNAVFQNSTKLWIDEQDTAAADITNLHAEVTIAGTAGNRAVLRIVSTADSNRWATWRVTDIADKGDHWEYTVIPRSSSGALVHDEPAIGAVSENGAPGASTAEAIAAAAAADASADAAAASAAEAGDAAQTVIDDNIDVVNASVIQAVEAAIRAENAVDVWSTSSTTAFTPAKVSKAFTVEAGKDYPVGSFVYGVSASVPAVYWFGQVTAYSGTTLTVLVSNIGTATNKNDWVIFRSSPAGVQGIGAGYQYSASTALSGDPTTGHFGFDNATLASATRWRVSKTDGAGAVITTFLNVLDDSTSVNRALITIRKISDETVVRIFYIAGPLTDATNHVDFPIIPILGTGALAADDACRAEMVPIASAAAAGVNNIAGSTGNLLLGGGLAVLAQRLDSILPRRNFAPGGALLFWPRGNSFASPASGSILTVPCWRLVRDGGALGATLSRQTADQGIGVPYKARLQRDNGNALTTPIEWYCAFETLFSLQLAGQTVVLSFGAVKGTDYSPASGLIVSRIATGKGVDQSADSMQAGTWTLQADNVVSQAVPSSRGVLTHGPFTIPSDVTQVGIRIRMAVTGTAQANDFVDLDKIYLHFGSGQALPLPLFDTMSLANEEKALQRYHYRRSSAGVGDKLGMAQAYLTTAAFGLNIPLPVPLRVAVTPTVSAVTHFTARNAAGGLGGAFTNVLFDVRKENIVMSDATGGSGLVAGNATSIEFNNAGGFIDCSAEL